MPAKVKKIYFESEKSVRQKHENSKVDYSIGECCGDRLKETYADRREGCKRVREGSMLYGVAARPRVHSASFLLQDNMNLKF